MTRAEVSGPASSGADGPLMQPSSAILSPSGSWTDNLPLDTLFDQPRRPLEVDVGCGKGRFLLARAKTHADTNFLGIDRLSGRLRRIDARILREERPNIRLLNLEAAYVIEYLLPATSVTVFYIFFPDPWPKRRHHRHRLFRPAFLDALNRVLVPGGQVHIATDHTDYFLAIAKLFRGDGRFVEAPAFEPSEEERTNFEITFLQKGAPISRGSFKKLPLPA